MESPLPIGFVDAVVAVKLVAVAVAVCHHRSSGSAEFLGGFLLSIAACLAALSLAITVASSSVSLHMQRAALILILGASCCAIVLWRVYEDYFQRNASARHDINSTVLVAIGILSAIRPSFAGALHLSSNPRAPTVLSGSHLNSEDANPANAAILSARLRHTEWVLGLLAGWLSGTGLSILNDSSATTASGLGAAVVFVAAQLSLLLYPSSIRRFNRFILGSATAPQNSSIIVDHASPAVGRLSIASTAVNLSFGLIIAIAGHWKLVSSSVARQLCTLAPGLLLMLAVVQLIISLQHLRSAVTTSELASISEIRAAAAAQVAQQKRIVLRYLSHEARIPIGTIHLGLRALHDRAATEGDAIESDIIGQIENAAGTLDALIRDCSQIADIPQTGLQLSVAPVDIRNFARTALDQTQALATELGINLQLCIFDEAPGRLSFGTGRFLLDHAHLIQVVSHVVGNAVKFKSLQDGTHRRVGQPTGQHSVQDASECDASAGKAGDDATVSMLVYVENWLGTTSTPRNFNDTAEWIVESSMAGSLVKPGHQAVALSQATHPPGLTGSPRNSIGTGSIEPHLCGLADHHRNRHFAWTCDPKAVLAPLPLSSFEVRGTDDQSLHSPDSIGSHSNSLGLESGDATMRTTSSDTSLEQRVQATLTGRVACVTFLVCDSGPGMPYSDLQYIFVPFNQLDGGGSTKVRGTGLGLAISREIVSAHGGSMGVCSGEGGGSDFFIRLPLYEVAALRIHGRGDIDPSSTRRNLSSPAVLAGDQPSPASLRAAAYLPGGARSALSASFQGRASISGAPVLPQADRLRARMDFYSPRMTATQQRHRSAADTVAGRRNVSHLSRSMTDAGGSASPVALPPLNPRASVRSDRISLLRERPRAESSPPALPGIKAPVLPSLPVPTAATATPPSASTSSSRSSPSVEELLALPRVRILVVDDVVSARRLLAHTLSNKLRRQRVCVVEFEEAEHGRAAVDAFRRALQNGRPYHVVLLDKEMPVMDGYEAVRRMRQIEAEVPAAAVASGAASSTSSAAARRARIVGCTANALREDLAEFKSNGVDEVLTKPIDIQSLTTIIKDGVKFWSATPT